VGIAATNAELVQGFDTFQISQNTKSIESIGCFLCVLFLDIPESCNKKTHWSVILVAKKEKGKQMDRLKNEGKRF